MKIRFASKGSFARKFLSVTATFGLLVASFSAAVANYGDEEGREPRKIKILSGPNFEQQVRPIENGGTIFNIGDESLSYRELDKRHRSAPTTVKLSPESAATVAAVVVELVDPPTLVAQGEAVKAQAEAVASSLDGDVVGAQEISSYRASLAQKQDLVIGALTGVVNAAKEKAPNSVSVERLDLAVNALVVKGVKIDDVKSALEADPALSARVKRVYTEGEVKANLSDSVALVKAPEVWSRTSGSGSPIDGTGTRIGILDTGVDYTHPDLGGCFGASCKVAGGYDFVSGDADPRDIDGHGTAVAAVAAGLGSYTDSNGNSQPLFGVAPGAKIYAFRVLTWEGYGKETDVLKGIERCVDPDGNGDFSDRLDVCNLSLSTKGNPDSPLSLAVDAAVRAGVSMVVSAGETDDINDPFSTFGAPASSREAITVGASCKPGSANRLCDNGIYALSMRGPVRGYPEILKPDVVAPGVSICTAFVTTNDRGDQPNCLDDKHITHQGTSLSAAHVAGVSALLRQAYPDATPREIKDMIIAGAADLGQARSVQGAGLANALDSYQKLQGQSPAATLTGLPARLNFDPATGPVIESRTVTIKNTSNSEKLFEASLQNASPALSATFEPQQVFLLPGESADVVVKFQADGGQIPSGAFIQGMVAFTSGSDVVAGWAYARIGNRVAYAPSSLDFGLINGAASIPNWSGSRVVTLTNRKTSSDMMVSVKVEFPEANVWPCNYKALKATLPSSPITIPAAGTFDLQFGLETTGLEMPNAEYHGLLVISSSVETIKVPFTLYKGWQIELDYGAQELKPEFVALLRTPKDQPADLYTVFPKAGESTSKILVPDSAPWFVDAHYQDSVVFKSNLTLTSDNTVVSLRDSEATIRIGTDAKLPNGDEPTKGYAITSIRQNHVNYAARMTDIGRAKTGWRTNKFTSDIIFSAAYVETTSPDFFVWQYFSRGNGSTSDVVLKQGNFVEKFIHAPRNELGAGDTVVVLFAKAASNFSVFRYIWSGTNSQDVTGFTRQIGSNEFVYLPAGTVARVYASKSSQVSPDSADFPLQPSFGLLSQPVYDGSIPAHLFYVFQDDLMVGEGESYALYPGYYYYSYNRDKLPVVKPDISDTLSLGAGPDFSNYKWLNWGPIYRPGFGLDSRGYSYSGGAQKSILFLESRMSYEFLRDNVLIKAGEREINRDLDGNPSQLGGKLEPGKYTLNATYKYPVANREMVSVAKTEFVHTDDTGDDQSPPALTSLAVIARDLLQNAVDASVENRLEFSLDAVNFIAGREDSLQNVRAEYSADGKNWVELSVQGLTATDYKAGFDADSQTDLHHFRVSAADSANNNFVYTFQMPSGVAVSRSSLPQPPEPTPTPTPQATPTFTPQATPTFTPQATPTFTPQATPTATPTQLPDGGVGQMSLPAGKVKVDGKKVEISMPALRQASSLIEAVKNQSVLRANGRVRPNSQNSANVSGLVAKCTMTARAGKASASRPFYLAYTKGATIRLASMKAGDYQVSYSCKVTNNKVKSAQPLTVKGESFTFTVK